MQLKALRYFIAVADNPTLSAAAQSLFVSQPALSQQIRKLEEEVGARLFERTGHMMRILSLIHISPITATVGCCAARRWTTIQPWSCWLRSRFPTRRPAPIWWRPLI